MKGKRAVEWRLVDAVYPTSRFKEAVAPARARAGGALGSSRGGARRRARPAQSARERDDSVRYSAVTVTIDRDGARRSSRSTAPETPSRTRQRRSSPPATGSGRCAPSVSWTMRFCGCARTSRRSARSSCEPQAIRRRCSPSIGRSPRTAITGWCARSCSSIKRTLKRVDLTSRSFFALVEPGYAFAGTLFELALAVRSDRTCSTIRIGRTRIALSAMNARRLSDEQRAVAARGALPRRAGAGGRGAAHDGAVRRRGSARRPGSSRSRPTTSTGTTRCAWRSRSARRCRRTRSPGMEANLRFAGPETLETKIFGRLTRVAELDLPAAERGGRARRAEGLRPRGPAGVRLEAMLASVPRARAGHRATSQRAFAT